MSDEQLGGQDQDAEEGSTIRHDDIVKRLLEYQRQLREGATPTEAAQRATSGPPLIDYSALEEQQAVATETVEVMDLAAAEAEAEARAEAEREATPHAWAEDRLIEIPEAEETAGPAVQETIETPTAGGDLAERVTALEKILKDLAKDLHDLRSQSQDYALVVDDRLAVIQAKVAEATGEPSAGS
jgi:hypothetical protein